MLSKSTLCFVLCPLCGVSLQSQPNIIVIMVDDAGYGDFGFHGSTEILTPNLDSLARESVRFTKAYATAPQCTPSRAAFVTGRYAQEFGFETNMWTKIHSSVGLPVEQVTLAERLSANGYTTGIIGKWHLGTNTQHNPCNHGFDEFYGFLSGAANYYPNETSGINNSILRGYDVAGESRYLTDAFSFEAVNFIERHQDGPFFLFVSFNAPHGPMAAPENLKELYAYLSEDPNRQLYAAVMTAMDIAVGRILSKLEDARLEVDTLVFFVNDNGGDPNKNAASNEPLRGEKTDLLEGGVRIPFLFRWPASFEGGGTIDFPVSLLDVAATSVSAAGLEIGDDLDGIDLVPYIDQSLEGPPNRMLFWRFRWPPDLDSQQQAAVIQGDFKWLDARFEEPALYNVNQDTSESSDLSEQESETASLLRSAFIDWERENLVEPLYYRPYFGSPFISEQAIDSVRTVDGHFAIRVQTQKEHVYELMTSADFTSWSDTGVQIYGDQSTKEILIPFDDFPKDSFFRFSYLLYDGRVISNPEWVQIDKIYED